MAGVKVGGATGAQPGQCRDIISPVFGPVSSDRVTDTYVYFNPCGRRQAAPIIRPWMLNGPGKIGFEKSKFPPECFSFSEYRSQPRIPCLNRHSHRIKLINLPRKFPELRPIIRQYIRTRTPPRSVRACLFDWGPFPAPDHASLAEKTARKKRKPDSKQNRSKSCGNNQNYHETFPSRPEPAGNRTTRSVRDRRSSGRRRLLVLFWAVPHVTSFGALFSEKNTDAASVTEKFGFR